MKLIHTSDWHLGQLFHGHEREPEHARFLAWLLDTLEARETDALLVAGDVFDHAHPSARSLRQFYGFLAQARQRCPGLEIIVIAGNHDSAGRLQAPAELLAELGTRIIGQVDAQDDPARACLPLRERSGAVAAWCLALPYLRPADVARSGSDGQRLDYPAGIRASYEAHLKQALALRQPGQALLAMGHLHARGAAVSSDSERALVIGGEEAIDAGVFDPRLAYVALGHLHKAQEVGGQARIRYSGSPFPLSFSEVDYRHQVVELELDGERLARVEALPIPRPVAMLRLPRQPQPLEQVIAELEALDPGEVDAGLEPWLEVRVLLQGPEPGLRARIEAALRGKPVRLVRISTSRAAAVQLDQQDETPDAAALQRRLGQPVELLRSLHEQRYGGPPGENLLRCFKELQHLAAAEDAR